MVTSARSACRKKELLDTFAQTFNTYLSKNIRRLSQKPRWAERLNKRQKVLSDEGKLPPSQDDSGDLNAIENPDMNK